MLGTPVERKNGKMDTVLVAARYEPVGRGLVMARAYERRYAVWSDVVLLDRDDLLERLRSRKRVVTGTAGDLPGDFVVLERVRLVDDGGQARIVAGDPSRGKDDLRLPLF